MAKMICQKRNPLLTGESKATTYSKTTTENKSDIYTSVNINEDTMTTYARKKKRAICMKNFGFSFMFGDVTALKIRQ
jgi:hypothetical protein